MQCTKHFSFKVKLTINLISRRTHDPCLGIMYFVLSLFFAFASWICSIFALIQFKMFGCVFVIFFRGDSSCILRFGECILFSMREDIEFTGVHEKPHRPQTKQNKNKLKIIHRIEKRVNRHFFLSSFISFAFETSSEKANCDLHNTTHIFVNTSNEIKKIVMVSCLLFIRNIRKKIPDMWKIRLEWGNRRKKQITRDKQHALYERSRWRVIFWMQMIKSFCLFLLRAICIGSFFACLLVFLPWN